MLIFVNIISEIILLGAQMSRTRNIFLNLVLMLFTIVVFIAVAEVITRVFWKVGYRHPYDWSDRLGGYSIAKENGVYRILLVGDSVAFGQGVKVEETFGKLIEDKLNSHYGSKKYKKYEVINVSWPGINTAQEDFILRERGLGYEPDMVLIAYFPNDSGPFRRQLVNPTSPIYIRRPPNRPGKEPYALPIPEDITMFLTLNSDLFMFTMEKYNAFLYKVGLRQSQDKDDPLLQSYEEHSIAWQANKAVLSDIYSLCKQNHIVPVLTIIPFFHALEDYKYKMIHDKVMNVATTIGFYSFDLLPFFEGKESASLIVSRIDSHPNAKAHQIIAKGIYNYISENKLIP